LFEDAGDRFLELRFHFPKLFLKPRQVTGLFFFDQLFIASDLDTVG
jgi:hypothetical protein